MKTGKQVVAKQVKYQHIQAIKSEMSILESLSHVSPSLLVVQGRRKLTLANLCSPISWSSRASARGSADTLRECTSVRLQTRMLTTLYWHAFFA